MGSASDNAVKVRVILDRHRDRERELEAQLFELLRYLLDRARWGKMHDVI